MTGGALVSDSGSQRSEPVLRWDVDAVSVLTLNRPRRLNAWNEGMRSGLVEHLRAIGHSGSVRAVVLTGAGGRAFCSGADLRDPGVHGAPMAALSGERPVSAFSALVSMRQPVVCAVSGAAIGAGFLLCLCCDMVVVGESAQFRLPNISLGLIPAEAGLGRLAQWVGRGRALDIALTGRVVTADEAVEIGLASSVVPDRELAERAMEVAQALGRLPTAAVRCAKESLAGALEAGSLSLTREADIYRSLALRGLGPRARAASGPRVTPRGSGEE